MKKLFNVKSLLLALVLVCIFGAVSVSATDPEYMTDNGVFLDGKYYLKQKESDTGVTYKSITKVEGKAGEAVTYVDTTTKYFVPNFKATYDGESDKITIIAYEGTVATTGLDGCKLYVVASDKLKTSITAAELKKCSKVITTAANGATFSLVDDLGIAIGKDAYIYAVLFSTDPTEKIDKPSDYIVGKVSKGAIDVSSVNVKYYLMQDGANTVDTLSANKKGTSGEELIVEDASTVLYYKLGDNGSWLKAKYAAAADPKPEVPGFNADILYENVGYAAGKKAPKLSVRVGGTSVTTAVTAGTNALDAAKRPGKEKTISLKLQAKAPSVKFDTKTGTIAIKNGFDYRIESATKTDAQIAEYAPSDWTTVIPYNAKGTANTAGSAPYNATYASAPNNYQQTGYVPEAKLIAADANTSVTGNEKRFTAVKVTSLSAVNDAIGSKFWIVRKSATTAAPASCGFVIEVPQRAVAPSVTAAADVEEVAGKVANIVVGTLATGTGDTVSSNEAKFEFAVINKTDLSKVEWSSVKWTAIKSGGKIKANARSKYYTSDDVQNATKYGDKAVAREHDPAYSTSAVIVIRRAGVVTGSGTSVVPSNVAYAWLRPNTTPANGKYTYTWTNKADATAAVAN